LMDYKSYNYSVFIFIIILFYTGEAVHREKSTKFDIINDAMPVPNTVFYMSKLLGLVLMALVLCTVPIVMGVLVQTLKGFTDYDFSIYLREMYLLTFPSFVEMILLSFAVHIIVNNKFGGHGVALIIWITMFMLRSVGKMDYNLFFYFYTPNYMWSDMNGIGHFMRQQIWFNFYWLMLGSLLVTLAFLFYRRGVTGGFKERWRVAMQRFKGWPVILSSLFFIAWLGSGAFIYYNVSILNNYYSAKENRKNLVQYEKSLKKYENLAQPKATSIIMNAAIYPAERKVDIDAKVYIKNKTSEAIPALHLMAAQNVNYNMIYNGKKIGYTSPLAYNYSALTFFKSGKDTFNYRIYTLPAPLLPGDSALMEIHSEIANHGFVNSGLGREILHNGTFFAGGLPLFGYAPENELESDEYRKKYGLPPKPDDLPEQDDPKGRNRLLFNNSADLIHFEATVSTTPDQIAIAPGYLQKTWMQDGRRYFSYIQDSPIQAFFSLVSAKYEVAKDSVTLKDGKQIAIEIFHDKKHPFNVNHFNEALKDGIQYFSETYGPFQFRQMRILEFPRYAGFAQSFPNTVPFAESFGWVADFKKPDDFDYVYYVTAHELAHQWWGHQVTPNDTRGANLISEALAEYSALILAERKFGKDNMKRFLKQEVDNYLTGRANEAKKENVFLYCNRAYEWYYKGSVILYGLRDLIGDSAVSNALHEFRDSFALKENPPFPGSNDLYRFIKRHTPDSIRYYLTDTWEKITLYENKMISAKAKEVGKNEYDVTLEFKTGKMYADSTGKETVAPMNDYIDVAIFGEETTDKAGRKKVNPDYIQKYKLTPGTKTMVIRVKGKPVKAGIDPYNKLIDRIPDDNLGDVEIK
ncbi:MAG: M1 family aminopeptidase, partial [Ginsengibacter sp.]